MRQARIDDLRRKAQCPNDFQEEVREGLIEALDELEKTQRFLKVLGKQLTPGSVRHFEFFGSRAD